MEKPHRRDAEDAEIAQRVETRTPPEKDATDSIIDATVKLLYRVCDPLSELGYEDSFADNPSVRRYDRCVGALKRYAISDNTALGADESRSVGA